MKHYKNPEDNLVYAYDPVTQQDLINKAVAAGWTWLPVWPLPPTDQQLSDRCKKQAMKLLADTDWTTFTDVTDPTNSPFLKNSSEFIAYRSSIRKYIVTPVPNPTWPTPPTPNWS